MACVPKQQVLAAPLCSLRHLSSSKTATLQRPALHTGSHFKALFGVHDGVFLCASTVPFRHEGDLKKKRRRLPQKETRERMEERKMYKPVGWIRWLKEKLILGLLGLSLVNLPIKTLTEAQERNKMGIVILLQFSFPVSLYECLFGNQDFVKRNTNTLSKYYQLYLHAHMQDMNTMPCEKKLTLLI